MAVSDDFNRADGSLGANWTNQAFQLTTPGIVSNAAWNSGASSFGAVYWSANAWNDDQVSQVTVGGTNTYVAASVRHKDSGAGTDFVAYFSHGSLQEFVNGSQGVIGTPSAAAVGNVIKLSVVGSTCTPAKDTGSGFVNQSGGTTSLATGSAGIAWFGTAASAVDWAGSGEISSGLTDAQKIPAILLAISGQMIGQAWA